MSMINLRMLENLVFCISENMNHDWSLEYDQLSCYYNRHIQVSYTVDCSGYIDDKMISIVQKIDRKFVVSHVENVDR